MCICCRCTGVRVMVFNAIINNISIISWRSVSLVGEKATDLPQVTVSHNLVSTERDYNAQR